MTFADWFKVLLTGDQCLPVQESLRGKLIHFQLVAREQIWLNRNLLWMGKDIPSWKDISTTVNVKLS